MKFYAMQSHHQVRTLRQTTSTGNDGRPLGSSLTSSASHRVTLMAEMLPKADMAAVLAGCSADQLDEVVRALRCIRRRQVRQRLKRGAEHIPTPTTAPEGVPVGESGRVEH